MTRDEAIKAMSEGKKVRHRYFGKDEWVTKSSNGLLTFEDGCSVSSELFWYDRKEEYWNDGWEIVDENK